MQLARYAPGSAWHAYKATNWAHVASKVCVKWASMMQVGTSALGSVEKSSTASSRTDCQTVDGGRKP